MDSFEPTAGPAEAPVELDRLLEALEHGVMILDKGRIVSTNRALSRLTGLPKSRLLGSRPSELLADADGRPVADPASPQVVRLRDKQGDLVPVSVRNVTPEIHLVVDRSREARLEREVWRLTEELRNAEGGAAPPLSNEELLGMIEHEIRTATTVIRGYNRMLLDLRVGPLNDDQKLFLAETRRATDRISSLLDNLLELASLECSGGLRIVRRRVALHPIVRAAATAAAPLLEDRGMQIELALDAGCDLVSADPASIEQVVINLLTNAAKFAPRGSMVRVVTELCESEEEGPCLRLTVRDEGPGVGPNEADEIFHAFVQGEAAASSPAGGVGLGLAICRRILAAHGGSVEALPCPRGGEFRVTMPLERLEGERVD